MLLRSTISLLIFYPFDLSITDRRVKSTTITSGFVYFSFQFCQFLLHVLWCSVVKYIHLGLSSWKLPLYHYVVPLFNPDNVCSEVCSDAGINRSWPCPGLPVSLDFRIVDCPATCFLMCPREVCFLICPAFSCFEMGVMTSKHFKSQHRNQKFLIFFLLNRLVLLIIFT